MSKILQALKNKYANLGLSEKAFSGVATFLEKTGITEDEIEARIAQDDVKTLLTCFQGEMDSMRTANHKLTKEIAELKKNTDGNQTEKEPNDAVADAIKALTEQFTAFKAESDAKLKKEHDANVIMRVHELMKEKGCVNDFIRNTTLKGITISDGDTAESLAEKHKAEYDKNFKEAFGDGAIPPYAQQTSKGYQKGDYSSIVEKYKAEGKIPCE